MLRSYHFPTFPLSHFPAFPLSTFQFCMRIFCFSLSHFPTFPLSHFPTLLRFLELFTFPLSHFPAFPLSRFPIVLVFLHFPTFPLSRFPAVSLSRFPTFPVFRFPRLRRPACALGESLSPGKAAERTGAFPLSRRYSAHITFPLSHFPAFPLSRFPAFLLSHFPLPQQDSLYNHLYTVDAMF